MAQLDEMRLFVVGRWRVTQAMSGLDYGILTLEQGGAASLVDPMVGLEGVSSGTPQLVSEGTWELIEGIPMPHETGCELVIRGFTMQMGEMAGATLPYRIATIAQGKPKFVTLIDNEGTTFLWEQVG